MGLFNYVQETMRLIGDTNQQQIPFNDLVHYVNRARRKVAELTQCVRVLTPISGSITTITVVNGGLGYTSPSVTISVPDSPSGYVPNPGGLQATAVPHLSGNVIVSITVSNPGSGYFLPIVAITDPTGSGAMATASISAINQTIANQEVYSFSGMALGGVPSVTGVASIVAIKSVSMLYENYRYALPMYGFSSYQAYIRRYPYQYSYVPTVGSQYGQGANGSLYLYPIASQNYQFECDCFCIPIDLIDDTTIDKVPQPWQDAVPYYAAYLALLQLQRPNDARGMRELFDKNLQEQSTAARPGRMTNPYGRY